MRNQLLRTPVGATVAVGAAAAGLGAVLVGRAGALAAVVATAVAIGFFLGGALPVLALDPRGRAAPAAFLLVLTGYALRVALLGVVAVRLATLTRFDRTTFGGTLILAALTWAAASVRAGTRPALRDQGAALRR